MVFIRHTARALRGARGPAVCIVAILRKLASQTAPSSSSAASASMLAFSIWTSASDACTDRAEESGDPSTAAAAARAAASTSQSSTSEQHLQPGPQVLILPPQPVDLLLSRRQLHRCRPALALWLRLIQSLLPQGHRSRSASGNVTPHGAGCSPAEGLRSRRHHRSG